MILGITPARGGSKSIPRKNILPIAGKPLLAWTVEAAKQSRQLDLYLVSTEDAEIAACAKSLGAEVLDRPRELAEDHVLTIDVLLHAVETLDPETVVLMSATSPVRRAGLVDECLRIYRQGGYDTVVTGFMSKHTPFGPVGFRRQDVQGVFCDNGSVYVVKASLIRSGTLCGENVYRYLCRPEENVEIDEPFDFWLAEKILSERETAHV